MKQHTLKQVMQLGMGAFEHISAAYWQRCVQHTIEKVEDAYLGASDEALVINFEESDDETSGSDGEISRHDDE